MGVVLFGFQVWINNVLTLPSDFFPGSAVASVAGLGGTAAALASVLYNWNTGPGRGPPRLHAGLRRGRDPRAARARVAAPAGRPDREGAGPRLRRSRGKETVKPIVPYVLGPRPAVRRAARPGGRVRTTAARGRDPRLRGPAVAAGPAEAGARRRPPARLRHRRRPRGAARARPHHAPRGLAEGRWPRCPRSPATRRRRPGPQARRVAEQRGPRDRRRAAWPGPSRGAPTCSPRRRSGPSPPSTTSRGATPTTSPTSTSPPGTCCTRSAGPTTFCTTS